VEGTRDMKKKGNGGREENEGGKGKGKEEIGQWENRKWSHSSFRTWFHLRY